MVSAMGHVEEDLVEVGEEEAIQGTLELEAQWVTIKALDAALVASKNRHAAAAACAALTHTLDRQMAMQITAPQPQPSASWLDAVFSEMKSNETQIQLLARPGHHKRAASSRDEVCLRLLEADRTEQQQQRGKRQCTWSIDELDAALHAFGLRNTCTTLAAWCPAVVVPQPSTTPRLLRHAAKQASRRSSKACRTQRRQTPRVDNMSDLDALFCRLGTA